jgi:hypothetical protein
MAVLAALTMTVGNLVALRQSNAVRLLAWSSIAQSGYMLVPLGAAGKGAIDSVLPATVAYVLAYAVMNLGAFSVVTLVGRRRPDNLLSDYAGLGRAEPLPAFALAFALACLAGLPPGLLGLFAKVVVFQAPVEQGTGWLAVVMAINVVIGLYYYLAWAARLYARPGSAPEPARGRTAWHWVSPSVRRCGSPCCRSSSWRRWAEGTAGRADAFHLQTSNRRRVEPKSEEIRAQPPERSQDGRPDRLDERADPGRRILVRGLDRPRDRTARGAGRQRDLLLEQ